MHRPPSILSLVGLALALGACEAPPLDTPDGQDPPPTDRGPVAGDLGVAVDAAPATPLDDDTRVRLRAAWEAGYCRHRARCLHEDAAHCISRWSWPDRHPAHAGLEQLDVAIAAGEVAVDVDAALACFADAPARCGDPLFAGPACARAFVGRLPPGAACRVSDSCGADAYCRQTTWCAGRCTLRGGAGTPCLEHDGPHACADGLACRHGACAAALEEGDPCDLDAPCPGWLACLDGRCLQPTPSAAGGDGAACTWQVGRDDGEVRAGVPRDAQTRAGWGIEGCGDGLACLFEDGSSTCREMAGHGEACRMGGCVPGTVCNVADGRTCQPVAAYGEACADDTLCPPGSGCHDGRCRLPARRGQPCAEPADCPGAECIDGACDASAGDAPCSRPWPLACNADEDCRAWPGTPARCIERHCVYDPAVPALRLVEPESTVPEIVEWLGGWPDDDGWRLLTRDGRLGLMPTQAEAAHPSLPAIEWQAFQAHAQAQSRNVSYEATRAGVAEPAPIYRPSADDPCRWVPTPAVSDGGVIYWSPDGSRATDAMVVISVPGDSGMTLGGRPADEVFAERGLVPSPANGWWRVRIYWNLEQAAGFEGSGAAAAGVGAVDVCEP